MFSRWFLNAWERNSVEKIRFMTAQRYKSSKKGRSSKQEPKVCIPPGIEGITGGRKDLCLVEPPPCSVLVCKGSEKSLEAIPPHEEGLDNAPPDAKVVVIGAGVAGLVAASHLVQNRIGNTTVLEALPRPGGRIQSVYMAGKVLEMGPTCPTESQPHQSCPVTDLAIAHGFMKPGQGDPTNGLLTNYDGTEKPLAVQMIAFQEFLSIREELQGVRCSKGQVEEELTQNLLKIRLNHLMERLPEESMEVAIKTIAGLLCMVTTPQIVSRVVAPFCKAGSIEVPMGQISLVSPYLERIGSDRIHYNKKVMKIKWGTVTRDQRPRALVYCADGSSYPADYVIVTLPLGVLKKDVSSIFCPSLPTEKMEAISKIENLQREVMYLSWPAPVWVWREKPLQKFWTEEDMEFRQGWLKGLRSVQELAGSDNILKVTIEGPECELFGTTPDLEIMNDFTDFLKEWQGDSRVPLPHQMFRSSWSTNPNFRGAYPAPNACPEMLRQLSAPVPPGSDNDPTVFFAGDATASSLCGGLGGAIISGVREAEKVVKMIQTAYQPFQHPCLIKCCIKAPSTLTLRDKKLPTHSC